MSEDSIEIGYRIRKIRESKDFNQKQVGDLLEITPGAYAKIERGETDPSITRLNQIAKILGVGIEQFLSDHPKPGSAATNVSTEGFVTRTEMEILYRQISQLTTDIELLKGAKKKTRK